MSVSVLLDARKLGDFGIGVYIENLILGLLDLQIRKCADLKLSILVPPYFIEAAAPIWVQELAAKLDPYIKMIPEPAKKYSFDEYFLMAKRQEKLLDLVDVYHSPHWTLPFFLKCPAVVTIHDIIHVTRPENIYHRLFAKSLIASAVKRASHIISVSEGSAHKLVEIVGDFSTPITVTANALQQGFEVKSKGEVKRFLAKYNFNGGKYCLFVGNDRPHKGFVELLEAWKILINENDSGIDVPALVVVGDRYDDQVKRLVSEYGLESKVFFVGWQDKSDLVYFYNGAKLVIVPSREEGFGLVALEALGCGVSVVCTPHASFREVCDDCAWYSQDYLPASLARVVKQALNNCDISTSKIERGLARVQKFTREACARATCSVYEEVLQTNPNNKNSLRTSASKKETCRILLDS